MDPLTLLARDDKWFLGGGKGAIWAPPFPKHINSFGYWDECYLADVRLQRLFTVIFLNANSRPVRFTTEHKGWRPDRLELVHRAPGILIREIRSVLECQAWISELSYEEGPAQLDLFLWSLQDLRPEDYGTPWSSLTDCSVAPDSIAFRVDTAWPSELEPDRTAVEEEHLSSAVFQPAMLPPLPIYLELGADQERISHTVNLAQRHDDSPLWETSVLPEKFSQERLPGDFKLRVGPGEPEGLVHLVQHYRLAPGERIQLCAAAGLSPAAAQASFESLRSTRAMEESESAWRRYFTSVPQFSSSDPWLTAAYWYRWYGLRLNTVDMENLPISRGSAFKAESVSGFQPENPGESPINKRRGAFLPHWTKEGGTYAVRFRLADAVPSQLRDQWREEREYLERAEKRGTLTPAQRIERDHLLSEKIDSYLDSGQGSCVLRMPEAAKVVRDALAHFDGARYHIQAWCVMPNHVHALVQPISGFALKDILHSWKSYTANLINRISGGKGQLWQAESYDHLIRDEKDFENQKAYILDNPEKAGLENWPWRGSASQAESVSGFQPENPPKPPNTENRENPEHGLEARETLGLEGQATFEFSPFVTEGIGFFRNFVTYSAQAHLREVVWMHDPRLAVGILENLGKCQRPDGSFPGHNYSCRPPRDFYHADLATGIRQLQALHGYIPTKSFVECLKRYFDYFYRDRLKIGEGILIRDMNETGQEYMSRYQVASEDADAWKSISLYGADAATYVYLLAELLTDLLGNVAEDDLRNWSYVAGQDIPRALAKAFDETIDHFFADRLDRNTHTESSPARPAAGLYPFLSAKLINAVDEQLGRGGAALWKSLEEWLATEFCLPMGFPATAKSDSTFSADAEWKQKRLNCPWNGRSWPMVNSHLADAAANVARTIPGSQGGLRTKASEALMKAIKLMFHDGDPRRPSSYEHYNPITGMPALYRGYDDYMHSWIVDLIMRHAVGVQPGGDEVDPLPLDVDWIECRDIPHPKGRMHVRIERGKEPSVEITACVK